MHTKIPHVAACMAENLKISWKIQLIKFLQNDSAFQGFFGVRGQILKVINKKIHEKIPPRAASTGEILNISWKTYCCHFCRLSCQMGAQFC